MEDSRESIVRHYSPAVLIKGKKSGWKQADKRGAPPLGGSRLGGWPDLPETQQWPVWQGRPMVFLAQINLKEDHQAQPMLRIPSSGLLLFFMGCNDEVYENEELNRICYMADEMAGMRADGQSGCKVLYVEDLSTLKRLTYSDSPAPQLYLPCEVSFSAGGNQFPDERTAAYETLELGQEQRDNYNEVLELLEMDESRWSEQLMGYPNLIQHTPPEWMCELASQGKESFTFIALGERAYEGFQVKASNWDLLIQFTSNGKADFMWGDGGHLYFYGKRAETEKGDFSSVWLNYET